MHCPITPILHYSIAERDRQPIHQVRMRRQRALMAEILLGLHNSAPEELGPEAVDRDTGGERIVAADEPLRYAQSVFRRARRPGVERGGRAGLHLLTLLEEIR